MSARLAVAVAMLVGRAALVDAQGAPAIAPAVPIAQLADSIAGRGTVLERTTRLVHWINDRFDWSATDYQQRSPREIIARRSGNCADLASVLRLMLDSLSVRSRWVHEINIQPGTTPARQKTADSLVSARGLSFSVFGLQHNDHVWLEVYDDAADRWFPADAAYGVVGEPAWAAARLSLERRPAPRVAAVGPIAADMVVPFVVAAGVRRSGPYDIDRTRHYLVDAFDRIYGGKASALPSWPAWVRDVEALSVHARAAFAGQTNLHAHTADIAALAATYERLRREALERGLRWR
ncbi:MAG: transglutaminase-like domain-containing protein [Gemmatimonadetes bacterium]|nr:transglutaminase-like domain-containing protein [Gemmatimonadota bacterium]